MPAALTSKIDPVTGFVDFLKPKYESAEKAQKFFEKFTSINYNATTQSFKFKFQYSAFTNVEGLKDPWTVCSSNDDRYRWNAKLNQGKGQQELVKVTEALVDLFGKNNIEYGNGEDIKNQIAQQTSADFFKELMRLLATLLSLRHNNGKKGDEERDFILSPVSPFFNSINASESEPKDADANGAYHIALKGLWALQQIGKMEDLKKVKLAISNKDWFQFVQERRVYDTNKHGLSLTHQPKLESTANNETITEH